MKDFPSSGDFFSRIPLFREFARLLSSGSGPVNWELARQVAVATAAGVDQVGMPVLPSPRSVDPAAGPAWSERLRLAELWLEPVISLPGPGAPVRVRAATPADWAELILPLLAPLFEPAAGQIHQQLGDASGVPVEMAAMVGPVSGLLFGMQVGAAVGQVARQVRAQYDLPLPSPTRGQLLVVPENVTSQSLVEHLPLDQLELWLATEQLALARIVEGVGWFDDYLRGLMTEVAAQAVPNVGELLGQLEGLDFTRPDLIGELFGGEQGLLGAPRTPASEAVRARLEVLLALSRGYALTACRRALEGRLPALQQIETAMAGGDQDEDQLHGGVARLLGADPGSSSGLRGAAFCREVLAATDSAGLERMWEHPDFLPTAEELDRPGAWLERTGMLGGEEVGLEEGLRALLDEQSDGGPPPAEPPAAPPA